MPGVESDREGYKPLNEHITNQKTAMGYSHCYPIYPTQEVAAELERHIDIHRQAYNYTRYEYENVDTADIGSAYKHHYRLPDWKSEFSVF